jgi:hypothetical protein
MVLNDAAKFDLAVRLKSEGAPLGEIYSFVSGLYFRGKLTYAQRFAAPPPGVAGSLVITSCLGLVPPEQKLTASELRAMSGVPIDAAEARYREPLERHARSIGEQAGAECEVVLLGSVATVKYLEPLSAVFGDRLLFPAEFAGRGDMSRGGLMLRAAKAGEELTYIPVGTATRHGQKPPRLPKLARNKN